MMKTQNEPIRKLHYFGTDGFRGEVGTKLTSMHAYQIGRFLGWYFSSPLSGCSKPGYRPRIVIGKDTRRSGYTLEYSMIAGITASGADVYMLHVTPTPGVAYITRQEAFDCGIMITASHNPFHDNGIKILNQNGEKLDDYTTSLIEAYLDHDFDTLGIQGDDLPLAQRENIGTITDYISGRNRYAEYLISIASHSYRDLRIGIDCANGASWMIAKQIFEALGAHVVVIGNEPDGVNINQDCGSTHTERLQTLVREMRLDVGFALDGDSDRCIAVDENGNLLDGDAVLYILARRFKEQGILKDHTVVATIMSNSGLTASLNQQGIHCIQTKVGDRYVSEAMRENHYALGGEQSGHVIVSQYATTGDGLLTAIMLLEEMCDKKCPVSTLISSLMLYPQHLLNLRVKDKSAVMNDPDILKTVKDAEERIHGNGRVLLRESGTEPVIRIMVEAETSDLSVKYAEMIADAIRRKGHCTE